MDVFTTFEMKLDSKDLRIKHKTKLRTYFSMREDAPRKPRFRLENWDDFCNVS